MAAIIGVGALSAAGIGAKIGWENLRKGRTFLTPHTLFDTGLTTTPVTGSVDSFSNDTFFSRTEALAVAAIDEALTGLDLSGKRVGLVVGTTVGGLDHSEQFYKELKANPTLISQAPKEFARHEPGALSGFLAKKYNCSGFHTLSTACSSGLHAIGLGHRFIENNTYDVVIALGVDALSFLTIRGFDSLLLVDYEGTKPFDKNRIGISLGEGAGAVILTNDSIFTPLAQVEGWGASADAYHMTAPHPEGDGATKAINDALSETELNADAIDFIIAHGTGTPDNDASETNTFKRCFSTVPPFTSLKGAIGHTLAASGALEVVYGIQSLNEQILLPTVNHTTPDPQLLSPITTATKIKATRFLKTAFGFGGNNGALIVSTIDAKEEL